MGEESGGRAELRDGVHCSRGGTDAPCVMSMLSRPTLSCAVEQRAEPSLREVLASLGIENSTQEKQRKRREAAARRRAALGQPAPGSRKARPPAAAGRSESSPARDRLPPQRRSSDC
jgi:hypothetical protein